MSLWSQKQLSKYIFKMSTFYLWSKILCLLMAFVLKSKSYKIIITTWTWSWKVCLLSWRPSCNPYWKTYPPQTLHTSRKKKKKQKKHTLWAIFKLRFFLPFPQMQIYQDIFLYFFFLFNTVHQNIDTKTYMKEITLWI